MALATMDLAQEIREIRRQREETPMICGSSATCCPRQQNHLSKQLYMTKKMRGFNRWMVKDLYGFQVLWPTLNSDDIVGSYKMGLDLKRKNEDKLQDSQNIHVIFYLYHFGKTINEPFRFPSKIKIRVVLSCRPACVRTHKTSTKRAINAVHNTCIGPLPAP